MKIWKGIVVLNITVTAFIIFYFVLIHLNQKKEQAPNVSADTLIGERIATLEQLVESLEANEFKSEITERIARLEQKNNGKHVAAEAVDRTEGPSPNFIDATDSNSTTMAEKSRHSLESHFGDQSPEASQIPELKTDDPTFGDLPSGTKKSFAGIPMIWCAPGKFEMGEENMGAGWPRNEIEHIVVLTRGFWIGETELTIGQWENGPDYKEPESPNSSFFGANNSTASGGSQLVELTETELPKADIAWNDCQEWIMRMNKAHPLPDGWKWELPTEAQWEYACRAGTTGLYAGDPRKLATFSEREASHVKLKEPNPWGIYDMHGNVDEWCADHYDQFYGRGSNLNFGQKNQGPYIDPIGPTNGSFYVARGGNFDDDQHEVRSAIRKGFDGWTDSHRIGFRPAIRFSP